MTNNRLTPNQISTCIRYLEVRREQQRTENAQNPMASTVSACGVDYHVYRIMLVKELGEELRLVKKDYKFYALTRTGKALYAKIRRAGVTHQTVKNWLIKYGYMPAINSWLTIETTIPE